MDEKELREECQQLTTDSSNKKPSRKSALKRMAVHASSFVMLASPAQSAWAIGILPTTMPNLPCSDLEFREYVSQNLTEGKLFNSPFSIQVQEGGGQKELQIAYNSSSYFSSKMYESTIYSSGWYSSHYNSTSFPYYQSHYNSYYQVDYYYHNNNNNVYNNSQDTTPSHGGGYSNYTSYSSTSFGWAAGGVGMLLWAIGRHFFKDK